MIQPAGAPKTTKAEKIAAVTKYDSVTERFKASFRKGVRNPLIPTPNPITKNKIPTMSNGMNSVFHYFLAPAFGILFMTPSS